METTKSKHSEEPMMNLKISPKSRPRTESLVKQNNDYIASTDADLKHTSTIQMKIDNQEN